MRTWATASSLRRTSWATPSRPPRVSASWSPYPRRSPVPVTPGCSAHRRAAHGPRGGGRACNARHVERADEGQPPRVDADVVSLSDHPEVPAKQGHQPWSTNRTSQDRPLRPDGHASAALRPFEGPRPRPNAHAGPDVQAGLARLHVGIIAPAACGCPPARAFGLQRQLSGVALPALHRLAPARAVRTVVAAGVPSARDGSEVASVGQLTRRCAQPGQQAHHFHRGERGDDAIDRHADGPTR